MVIISIVWNNTKYILSLVCASATLRMYRATVMPYLTKSLNFSAVHTTHPIIQAVKNMRSYIVLFERRMG